MAVKIYLVEDEKNLNLLLQKYLQNEGYEVTTFLDGKSAMERIKYFNETIELTKTSDKIEG